MTEQLIAIFCDIDIFCIDKQIRPYRQIPSADTGDFHSVKPLILRHILQILLRLPVQYKLRIFQRCIVDQPVQL